MNRIDSEPIKPGWGCIWQGSELNALFDLLPAPRAVVSLIGDCSIGPALSVGMLDDEAYVLPDDLLLAMADGTISFLKHGRNVLIHCFQGKYRSTYMDVAVHMRIGMSFDQAFALVKEKHPIADLRAGTMAQLKRMESTLNGGFNA